MNEIGGPLVSIIITTQNRRAMLEDAVNSALTQTYRPIEIVIVDDGSTDDTAAFLNFIEAKHGHVRTVRHSYARGGNAARNSGIRAARGQFIAGLDDDDILMPNHVYLLMKNYASTYSVVAGRATELYPSHEAPTPFHGSVPIQLITLYNAIGNQGLVEKVRLEAIGLYDESLPRYQDHDIWIRLVDRYGPALVIFDITQRIRVGDSEAKRRNRHKDIAGAAMLLAKHKNRMSLAARAALRLRIMTYRWADQPGGRVLDLACKILTKVEATRVRFISTIRKDY